MNIYLAGGMHSEWRNEIMEEAPQHEYFDPCSNIPLNLDENGYTTIDLAFLRWSDLIIAYMDASNPSGYGLNLEVGYAVALGKRVWFIDETDEVRKRYFGMCRAASNRVFSNLGDAIKALKNGEI